MFLGYRYDPSRSAKENLHNSITVATKRVEGAEYPAHPYSFAELDYYDIQQVDDHYEVSVRLANPKLKDREETTVKVRLPKLERTVQFTVEDLEWYDGSESGEQWAAACKMLDDKLKELGLKHKDIISDFEPEFKTDMANLERVIVFKLKSYVFDWTATFKLPTIYGEIQKEALTLAPTIESSDEY